ncbi:hypothetical protein BGZ94_007816 [Podila epigama]|nr:hypothetical protein BGZ94_007816 [Podila epigama]
MILRWTTLLAVVPDALYTDRCHYFECILALMTRKEFDEFDRVEDSISKPTTPSTIRTFIDGSVTEQNTSSSTSVSSSTTLGSGYPFTDSGAFWLSFHQYRKTLTQSLQYAIQQLNEKGVYSNVITFCAKILALCFFKLPGVAFGLLHALPVSRSYITRMAKALDIARGNTGMPQISSFFPDHLSSVCFEGSSRWWSEFEKQKRKIATREAALPMEIFGNWVRRWQSDDSELFFAFFRHYNHCLAQYLEAPLTRLQAGGWATSAISPRVYAGAPGYVYLAAFFLTKIEGLVHGEIHPVTTIVQFEPNSANGNVDRDRAMASVATGEFPGTGPPPSIKLSNGADSSGDDRNKDQPTTGKPKMLDMASRRCVDTIVAILEEHGNIYGAMLDIWIKTVVTKTSVYDVESVFCLLDFLDMLFAELETRETIRLYDSELSNLPQSSGAPTVFTPIHVQFILTTLHLLLTSSDHTVTLMRTISFIYQNFSLLTGTVQSLEQLTLVWKVARIGGGVGILPGWKPWVSPQQQQYKDSMGGMMAMNASQQQQQQTNYQTGGKKKTKETTTAAALKRASPLEQSLNLIVRNIFEVMESRIDTVKRQYAGELSEVMSPRMSERDNESVAPESTPSSPGMEQIHTLSAAAGGSPVRSISSLQQRSLSDLGTVEDEGLGALHGGEGALRSLYQQQQAHQIYLAQQKLTMSSGSLKEDVCGGKDRSKKSTSRSSLISRKFRRLSRSETLGEQNHRNSLPDLGDPSLYDLSALMSGSGQSTSNNNNGNATNASKRASTGSLPITGPGSLFRWMFLSSQNNGGSKLSALAGFNSTPDLPGDQSKKHSERFSSASMHSLASQSTGSSTSLTMLVNGNSNGNSNNNNNGSNGEHGGSDFHQHGGRSAIHPGLDSGLRYRYESRKYPEHLTTYAGRSIPEHSAVLNEYVDWLAQCHSYGIKVRAGFGMSGGQGGGSMVGPSGGGSGGSGNAGGASGQPGQGQGGGGVHGLGIGTLAGPGNELFGDFSVFSLSMGVVVDASTISGQSDEWILPGMAQMMMLRFPGLVVEWPKFWNNSRESGGPPPGPITTLPALAVVNNPALSLSKGNAGGVGGGVGAGAGGPFGGASATGHANMNGPSSLRHQQQAQMHHQQQMQLWSPAAAAAAVTAAAAASVTTTHIPMAAAPITKAGAGMVSATPLTIAETVSTATVFNRK